MDSIASVSQSWSYSGISLVISRPGISTARDTPPDRKGSATIERR